MKISQTGIDLLIQREGFVPKLYLDAVNVPTIGVGFTWASASFRKWWGDNKPGMRFAVGATMTREEAMRALAYLCEQEYGKAVNDFLGKDVPQHVFDAAVSMVFNCGPGALKWKWAAEMKGGNYTRAATLLRSTAVTAKGKRLQGLVNRRASEADQMLGKLGAPKSSVDSSGPVRMGDRGLAVTTLQNLLNKAGFGPIVVDGHFGQATKAAVLEFQRAKGLVVDGIAGGATFLALQQASAAPPPWESPTTPAAATEPRSTGLLGAILAILARLFGKG